MRQQTSTPTVPWLVATVVVVIGSALAGATVAIAAGDPTPTPPPRVAIVARGDGTNFADALTVGSVAGQLGAPVYTTTATFLPDATAAGLEAYAPELVIITGGVGAVSQDVEARVAEVTGLAADQVVRAAGDDRYETAVAISRVLEEQGLDPAYLPVASTATDSDLLDGRDASDFLGATDTAVDAAQLGGVDANQYPTVAWLTGLLPVATFTLDETGAVVTAGRRAPVEGPPNVLVHTTGQTVLTLPLSDVNDTYPADLFAVTCTAGTAGTIVTVLVEDNGGLTVDTVDTDGTEVDDRVMCAVHTPVELVP